MTRVKLCGVTDRDDLAAVADAGSDAVGVICDVPVETPREVSAERASEIVAAAPPLLTTVLVTMPEDAASAAALANRVGPDAVQVHGGLGPDAVATLAESVSADVLVAVDADDVESARRYDGIADALVVDSVDDDGGGGTGETHDWNRTRAVAETLDAPVVLAGGLTPANVAEAVRTVDPYAVDAASGVEVRGGEKDHEAVRAFVAAVRRVEMESERVPAEADR